ncbi:uncharacterized protein LOC143252405 isoform X5 [Tachypleus tridentatus]|uniref:uncharacterized protein LOC143252405 isoform X5 n=1 Tax=Tachypleus tridentatus TaxID=6853 RepID=UPI003FD200A0
MKCCYISINKEESMLKTVSSFQKLYTVTTCDKSTKQKIVCRYLKKQYKVTTRDESNYDNFEKKREGY